MEGEDFGPTSDARGNIWLLMGWSSVNFGRQGDPAPPCRPRPRAWSLHADSRSNLWVCTSHRGLSQISPTALCTVGADRGTGFALGDPVCL